VGKRQVLCLAWVAAIALSFGNPALSVASNGQDQLDAKEYASLNGVTETEATARLALQPAIGQLQATLAANEGESFGGLYVTHAPAYRVNLLFTKNGVATANRYLDGGPLKSLVNVHQVTYSLTTLLHDRDTASAATGLPATVDVQTNRVLLQVPSASSYAAAGTPDSSRRIGLPPSVVIVPPDPVAVLDVYLFGGLNLSGLCTSGFTVYYGTNTTNRGITTAGHCGYPLAYQTQLSYQWDSVVAGDRDVETFKLAGASYPNWVYDGLRDADTYYRPIIYKDYRASQYVNEFVCHYGIATGYGCGYIVSTAAAGPHNGTHYIRVHGSTQMSSSGDSGGPWVINRTALGTDVGHIGTDALYSAIDYVEQSGYITIATS
jgi:streptogrisin C